MIVPSGPEEDNEWDAVNAVAELKWVSCRYLLSAAS